MSRIFLSHSSANNLEAAALNEWLKREGWEDVFLDIDPDGGIAPGERWEKALNEAASRCEAVLFLISWQWLASAWCLKEFNIAHKLNKRLFGLLLDDIPNDKLPFSLTSTWQFVRLCSGNDRVTLKVAAPFGGQEASVAFSADALSRLRTGLHRAGLDPRFFAWPPDGDKDRPPYRGLRPLEADDAGIFYGRDASIVDVLDTIRGLRDGTPPRLLIILGASGAGKSSFLRAGLSPRLARDDQNYLLLPIVRPERTAISGDAGFMRALEGAFNAARLDIAPADLQSAIQNGANGLKPLLKALAAKAKPPSSDHDKIPPPPALILAIDQGEELFLAEGQNEAQEFLLLLRDLLVTDAPAVIAVFTIRSDSYERLQLVKELEGVRQKTLSLPPMPKGSYSEVIRGPARRLERTARPLKIEESLVNALLMDIEEEGEAKDALPLLAFTMERLYSGCATGGSLKLSQYNDLGRIKGSIEAAVEAAFKAADNDPAIPKDRAERLALLRRGLIPWLAGIDAETGMPRRRVARLSEIPAEARPLIQHFVQQRLLTTDVASDTSGKTIEPAHEALLRQWSLLQGWLADDAGLLSILDGVKRASRDWAATGRASAWLTHLTGRLEAAEHLSSRPDLVANLTSTDREYLAACRKSENALRSRRRQVQAALYLLLVGIIAGLVGWINQAFLKDQWREYTVSRPFMQAKVRPYVLTATVEQALKAKDTFSECAQGADKVHCSEMVVIPAGSFMMGSPATEKGRYPSEDPLHRVTIGKPFAVAEFALTFDEWDTCVTYGACPQGISDDGWGRGRRPVINVSWDDAQRYAAWLSKMTGKPYRLLTEAEDEYATRAGTQTAFPWGEDLGKNNAACLNCGTDWDNKQESAPVGSFKPNAFGLYDMVGNVYGWVEDCYNRDYNGAPTDGSAWLQGDCKNRMARGGSWFNAPVIVRSANRAWFSTDVRLSLLGFRVARTLIAP